MLGMTGSRPGGRSARVRDAVHAAVLDLLAEGGLDISIAEVARRAGVNPTSIYRRWGDRERLILDAALTRLLRDFPMPDTGSLRGDLLAWARRVERQIAAPDGQVTLRALIATLPGSSEAAEARMAFLNARLTDMQAMLDRAAARGEHPPTAQRVIETVLAPLYMNVLFIGHAPDGCAADLVEALLGPAAS